jgi:hypothetical protein
MAVAVAAMLLGSVTAARAESGQMLMGGRLAYNYSTLVYGGNANYTRYGGGSGFEGGLLGRFALVEGQMGVHVGANFIYKTVLENTNDMAVGVPILFEINPFVVSGLNSSIYEMIFVQIGLQPEYLVAYSEYIDGKWVTEVSDQFYDREKFNIGLVIGAVGYFNSHVSFDIRYNYGLIPFARNTGAYDFVKNWYPYSITAGLSFYL